jgi:ABC-type uncharacterized transport system fused permease/ATPase subunit
MTVQITVIHASEIKRCSYLDIAISIKSCSSPETPTRTTKMKASRAERAGWRSRRTKAVAEKGGWRVRYERFKEIAKPFWVEKRTRGEALGRAGSVIALTLLTTGVTVAFSYLNRDFISAISERDVPRFWRLIATMSGAISLAIPVFVLRGFLSSRSDLLPLASLALSCR